MPIKIKDLTVKNFMSVGNQTQAIDFSKEQLTLVLGENLDQGGDDTGSRNGTGKTTIINALSYALYGQALTNIKRNNLINKTNSKGMLVTLHFEKNNTDYRIERGRSPNVMKFYINNQEQEIVDESQGDSRKTQESINELLGMSHDMFKHVVALNTYTEPFLNMRQNDQRMIIEQLLGITLLSEKAERLKEQVRSTKEAISDEEARIRAVQTSNERIQDSIDSLKLKQSAWKAQKEKGIGKLQRSITELEQLDIENELVLHQKLADWNEHNNAITALNKERATLENALTRADKTVDKVKKDIEELETAICYACNQPLHADKKQEMVDKKSKELEDAVTYQTEITRKLTDVEQGLTEIGDINGRPNTFYDTVKEAYEHKENVGQLRSTLERTLAETDPYQEQIEELSHTALQEIVWDTVNTLTDYKEHQEFLLKLLTNKDSFIRKKIID